MKKSLELYYKMSISKDGKTVKRYRRRVAHSFVRQFMDYIFSELTLKPAPVVTNAAETWSNGSTGICPLMDGPYVGTGYAMNYISPYPPTNPYMTGPNTPAPFSATESSYQSYSYYRGWTLFCSHGYYQYDPVNNYWTNNTYWQSNGYCPQWVRLDIGEGNAKIAQTYSVQASYVDQTPCSWQLQGSNNDSTWTDLHSVTDQTWSSTGQWLTFTCTDQTTAYRYFRFYATKVYYALRYPGNNTYPDMKSLVIKASDGVSVVPVTINDYAMVNTNTGLTYGSTSYAGPLTDSSGSQFLITRVFTNNTASSIVINEIGLYAYQHKDIVWYNSSVEEGYSILMARDIVDPSIAVAPAETLTLTYILATTI